MDEGVDLRLAGLKELHRLSLLGGADSNELYRQYLEVGCRLLGCPWESSAVFTVTSTGYWPCSPLTMPSARVINLPWEMPTAQG